MRVRRRYHGKRIAEREANWKANDKPGEGITNGERKGDDSAYALDAPIYVQTTCGLQHKRG